jgi:alpha-beta hydrolase superfamily lysophospholipase
MATLLFDLLTTSEATDRRNVFNVHLLASRVQEAILWSRANVHVHALPVGLFGASTGSAAALAAAAAMPDQLAAVVSRGGRPDLAGSVLAKVRAPTLLIVGENDDAVLELNQDAYAELTCKKHLCIVAGATHLFEEPGALEQVARAAGDWFDRYLTEHKS